MDRIESQDVKVRDGESTGRGDPRGATLHEIVSGQAADTPQKVAVVFEGHSLSYQELETRSNQLAQHLRTMGVQRNDLVALCVERSLEMMIGLLGILKAGGAYVPLDPSYPADRLAYMLNDSGARLLLTQGRLRSGLPEHQASVLCLDDDWSSIAGSPETPPPSVSGAEDLAYVIYTSGSTGRPKGVEIPHRALVNFLCSMAREPGLTADDKLLAVTTLSFDIAGLELYLPLTVGAQVVVASRTMAADGNQLARAIDEMGITVMQATPATWRLLLEADWAGCPGLRIFCGGETLPEELAARLLPRCGELWNLYGPTETTIWSTLHRVEATGSGAIPIGHPIANTEIQILDEQNRPVPDGSPGELFVGGDGLARGYFNRAELTGERFIEHPLDSTPGARLYRTGDLARRRPDGNIEHLGRVDFQVKVRGFRIELGEIEAALDRQDSVRQAVVLAREDRPGEKRLVAYLVPAGGQMPATRDLRDSLSATLPDYMVPGYYVVQDALPLTPNGKVDRNALPAPDSNRPVLANEYVAPRNEKETLLAEIWSEVLRVEAVGVDDNFFELGGDSLKVAQVATRIRSAFSVDIALRSVFEKPTVAGLLPIIEASESDTARLPELPIAEVRRGAQIPLSFAQERVWFLHQLNPDNLAYNFQSTVEFSGSLDVKALERALGEILRRHESYRTTFPTIDGSPVEVVHPFEPFTLPVVDFSDKSGEERERAVKAWCDDEFQLRFDLARLPLVRWTLLRYSENEQVLVHMEHHLVHDGWAFNLFLRELADLYMAYAAGEESPLPEIPVQFAEFATWQHQWMQGAVSDHQLAFWKQKFATIPPVLELPTKGVRPAVQSFRGASLRPEIPLDLCNALRALSRTENSTLFMTMLAGFVALLHRYTGEPDVAIGTFFANRRTKESESLIGMILNNTVIRASLESNPTVVELMGQVRDLVLEAASYQDVPFDRVVEAAQPKRDMSYNPLFQIMFSFHDEPMPEEGLPGLEVNVTPVISNGSSKFDLGVIGIPHSAQRLGLPQGSDQDGITMIWEHNTDLFETATIERMVEHYKILLRSMVADPCQRVSDLSLSGEAERHALLSGLSASDTDYPGDQCLHELVQSQSATTPDAIAVVFEGDELSYGDLDKGSNQLANHLRGLGVKPGVLVGICVERSTQMLVGLLGILKAGGAYVPIDPAFPDDRRAFMIEDARIGIVITEESLCDSLPLDDATVVRLDADAKEIAEASEEAPRDTGVTPEDLAYVIYTSGSTGLPKGVEVPHRAVVNFLSSMREQPGLAESDRLFAVTTLSFDIAGLELYLPLVVGAMVIIGSRAVATNGEELARQLTATGATVMQATPTTWQLLLDTGWTPNPGFRVLCGGEALPRQLAEQLLKRIDTLWNMYGPTETTIWSTIHRVESGSGPVPIGKPIGNTQIYLLDRYDNLVPADVLGELCIGGDGVSKGYLNRPDLTAEKFIRNPVPDAPNSVIYRTGDLARYRTDGTLECLGRTDLQIKMRGFRIELGEIETLLEQQKEVRQAIVTLREDQPGDQRLVAYLVLDPDDATPVRDILARLQQKLPDYMVPSAAVVLESVPLTPNGKVDRKALPIGDLPQSNLASDFVAPGTPTEQALAEIWAEVLGVDEVGIDDDFFDLGGHSLLAVRLFAKIEERLGKRLPLATLLQAATIRRVAGAFEASNLDSSWSNLVPIQTSGTTPPLFCIHAEGGEVLFYRDFAKHLGVDQPVYGLQAQGLDGQHSPDSSVEEMAARYIEAMRTAQPQGPYYLAGHCNGGVIAFEMAHQLLAAGDEVALLAMLDGAGPPVERTLGDTIGRAFAALRSDPVGLATYMVRREIPTRWKRFLAKRSAETGGANGAESLEPNTVEDAIAKVTLAIRSAYHRYEPKRYPGKIICFVNSERAMLGANRWSDLTMESLDQLVFPGTPETSFQEPSVKFLAESLHAYLDRSAA